MIIIPHRPILLLALLCPMPQEAKFYRFHHPDSFTLWLLVGFSQWKAPADQRVGRETVHIYSCPSPTSQWSDHCCNSLQFQVLSGSLFPGPWLLPEFWENQTFFLISSGLRLGMGSWWTVMVSSTLPTLVVIKVFKSNCNHAKGVMLWFKPRSPWL